MTDNTDYYKLKELQKRFDRLLKDRNKLDIQCQMQAITINNLHKVITKLKHGHDII